MIGYPTSDRVQLRQWVAEHPGCNFAIAAGAEWGLIVLEVAGRRSMASLRALCGDDWTWRDSCEFHAGNAQFFIFAHPGQGTRLIDPCLAGVTLHEGLVMAPPSRLHTGEVFAYTRPDAPLLSVPAWLLDQDDNQR
jgi:hypothetical protein